MKNISFLFVWICLLVSCHSKDPSPAAQNLLTDGDMETANGGDWTAESNGYGIYTWTTAAALSGTHSLAIEVDADGSNTYSVWNKYLATTSSMVGKDFTFTASVKGKNLLGNGSAIGIEAVGANNNPLFSDFTADLFNITGTFDWTTYRVKIENLPAATTRIYVFLYMNQYSQGTVYFDNATLTSN